MINSENNRKKNQRKKNVLLILFTILVIIGGFLSLPVLFKVMDLFMAPDSIEISIKDESKGESTEVLDSVLYIYLGEGNSVLIYSNEKVIKTATSKLDSFIRTDKNKGILIKNSINSSYLSLVKMLDDLELCKKKNFALVDCTQEELDSLKKMAN